jgi:hypothetical protein
MPQHPTVVAVLMIKLTGVYLKAAVIVMWSADACAIREKTLRHPEGIFREAYSSSGHKPGLSFANIADGIQAAGNFQCFPPGG